MNWLRDDRKGLRSSTDFVTGAISVLQNVDAKISPLTRPSLSKEGGAGSDSWSFALLRSLDINYSTIDGLRRTILFRLSTDQELARPSNAGRFLPPVPPLHIRRFVPTTCSFCSGVSCRPYRRKGTNSWEKCKMKASTDHVWCNPAVPRLRDSRSVPACETQRVLQFVLGAPKFRKPFAQHPSEFGQLFGDRTAEARRAMKNISCAPSGPIYLLP